MALPPLSAGPRAHRAALALTALLLGGCLGSPHDGTVAAPSGAQPPGPALAELPGDPPLRYAHLDQPGTPRIVFLHGSPGDWQAFAGYLRRPKLRTYGPLLAPDRPGWGGSGAHRVVGDLGEQARRLAPLLRGAGAPAIVVGHSLGGAIAARLAMDEPALVRGLLLVAPSVAPQYEYERWYQRLAGWRLVQWLLPQALVDSNRELAGLQAQLRAMAPRWAALRMPVYVVQGEDDALVDPRTADFLEQALAQTPHRIWRYPRAGHLMLWQQPERVVAALQALVAASGAPPNDRQ